MSNMTTARDDLTSSSVGSRIYCIGGSVGTTNYLTTNACYIP